MTTPPAIINPPRLHAFSASSSSFSIIFPFLSFLFYAKSVLIANHHGPAKWQIILHSFITKPSSSYFVSQHVQYAQLPCLLIQSASQREPEPWQITLKSGGGSPPQPQIYCNNTPYFLFKKERKHLHVFKNWSSVLHFSTFISPPTSAWPLLKYIVDTQIELYYIYINSIQCIYIYTILYTERERERKRERER